MVSAESLALSLKGANKEISKEIASRLEANSEIVERYSKLVDRFGKDAAQFIYEVLADKVGATEDEAVAAFKSSIPDEATIPEAAAAGDAVEPDRKSALDPAIELAVARETEKLSRVLGVIEAKRIALCAADFMPGRDRTVSVTTTTFSQLLASARPLLLELSELEKMRLVSEGPLRTIHISIGIVRFLLLAVPPRGWFRKAVFAALAEDSRCRVPGVVQGLYGLKCLAPFGHPPTDEIPVPPAFIR